MAVSQVFILLCALADSLASQESCGPFLLQVKDGRDAVIMQDCHTVTSAETDEQLRDCYARVRWVKDEGLRTNPQWYPTLKGGWSTFEEVQDELFARTECLVQACPPQCRTASPGDTCYEAIEWAMTEGIHLNQDTYRAANLTAASSPNDFQYFLYRTGTQCLEPPCEIAGTTLLPLTTSTTTHVSTTLPQKVWRSFGNHTACRLSPTDFTADGNGTVSKTWTASLGACQSACEADSTCTGIEYWGNGGCELWSKQVGHSITIASVDLECFAYMVLPATTSTTTRVSTTLSHKMWGSFGNHTACRLSPTDFTADGNGTVSKMWTGSLGACQSACEADGTCTGVEYWGNGGCELWTEQIGHSITIANVDLECLAYIMKTSTTSTSTRIDLRVWDSFGNETACRLSPADFTSDGNGTVSKLWTGSLDACKAACHSNLTCTGIEFFLKGGCELWFKPIGHSISVTDFGMECFTYVASTSSTTTTLPSTSMQWESLGPNTVCRVDSADFTSDGRGTATSVTVPDLFHCQRTCEEMHTCVGVEFVNTHCELWTKKIGFTRNATGYECLQIRSRSGQQFLERTDAAVHPGEELGLYVVGDSSVSWMTWPDQLHLMLKQLGFSLRREYHVLANILHPYPERVPRCDDYSEFIALELPRISKVGWNSWGFAYESREDCSPTADHYGFRTIAGRRVRCANNWACNLQRGTQLVQPSQIAEEASQSHAVLLSNWVNDGLQQWGNNYQCYDGVALSKMDTVSISIDGLLKLIQAIHKKNSSVHVFVMAVYPGAKGDLTQLDATLPTTKAMNAAVKAAVEEMPNVTFVDFNFPSGEVVFQSGALSPGHPNCRGDKVEAAAALDALFNAKIIGKSFALGDEQECLGNASCGILRQDCCHRSALCRWKSGACIPYRTGEDK